MIARSLRHLALALSLALLPPACGDGSTTTTTSPLTCQAGQFRLQGTLGNQSVDITESSGGGGLTQVDSGELQIGQGIDPSAPAHTQMDLVWPHGILDGASSSASGTVTMASGPYAGQALCAGNGTSVTIYKNDNGVGFVLGGVASGGNCETPIEGALAGCWH
jgi:hypothetical protein